MEQIKDVVRRTEERIIMELTNPKQLEIDGWIPWALANQESDAPIGQKLGSRQVTGNRYSPSEFAHK